MRKSTFLTMLLYTLAGCGQQETAKAPAAPEKAAVEVTAEAPVGNTSKIPDVGKVESVSVTTQGTGISPGAAINDALKTAITQVNGVRIESTSVNVNSFAQATATLDVETSEGRDSAKATATVHGQAFAERIIAQSQGLITTFKVLKITPPKEPGLVDKVLKTAPQDSNSIYSVEIEATIAKFKAPEDSNKIKIIVAPLRATRQNFDIGDTPLMANDVTSGIRQQMIDALTQTGRFTVLDREFDDELQDELALIGSGKTENTSFAKLKQALSADLVWVGVVNNMAYAKNVRKSQTSDRELVSYSGGWSVSQRMINLATRQILQSNTLQGQDLSPDRNTALTNAQNEIVKKAVESIILQTFPISIVERDGNNVILSQGGQTVSENNTYRVYFQGKEIKDPQTGQSLGFMESVCCDVLVKRVTPNLSYGLLENIQIDLVNVQSGALLIREAVEKKAESTIDSKNIKIVVAPLRSTSQNFDIGGTRLSANAVLGGIRQQVIDALSQTGRFTVLDRQFDDELQDELALIGSGETGKASFAKLNQALSADLIWVGVVNNMAYTKNVRRLQTSDRELVSYSGGWSVSQRMINLATRQILQSSTLQGKFPSIAPTTLGAGPDRNAALTNAQNEIVKKTVESIVLQIFPISIVKRDGNNVVLSQGGQTVLENNTYRVYFQGEEIKDPQTGQSLGFMESVCCDVLVKRVTPNLSYGLLENIQIDLAGVQPGALLVREAVEKQAQKPAAEKSTDVAKANKSRQATQRPIPAIKSSESDDW
jgi:curli biogenesis system outer membrane secretion channel CsgG